MPSSPPDGCCRSAKVRRASIVVFAKAPVAGEAKTRLAPALGLDGAAELARRLLLHAVETARAARLGIVEICAAPDASHPVFAALAVHPEVRLSPQGRGDLGARMARALERRLSTDAHVLLMGTDAPGLSVQYLHRAAAALDDRDAVFAPARDGGYALVGLNRPAPALFQDIAWSTPGVMAATRERARQAGISLVELDPVDDIDQPRDLVHVPRRLLAGLEVAASTASSLPAERDGAS